MLVPYAFLNSDETLASYCPHAGQTRGLRVDYARSLERAASYVYIFDCLQSYLTAVPVRYVITAFLVFLKLSVHHKMHKNALFFFANP